MIGTLVGLEIPLLMRILKERFQFRDLVAHVLTFDYLGALGASLLFPLLLVPKLGLVRSALLFGIINAGVALWSTFLFRDQLGRPRVCESLSVRRAAWRWAPACVGADAIAASADDNLYADESDLRAQHALSADRVDQVERRSAAVPEFASAVQLARRVSLSRSAGASGTGGSSGRAASAGAGRRRWTGGARDSRSIRRSSRSRWWIWIRR